MINKHRSDEGPTLETLDFTFYIDSTPTFLYLDLYLNTAYAAHYILCFSLTKGLRSKCQTSLSISGVYTKLLTFSTFILTVNLDQMRKMQLRVEFSARGGFKVAFVTTGPLRWFIRDVCMVAMQFR